MKRTNDFAVGLTIILGSALILAATLWVKQATFGPSREKVTARFRDVGNVTLGSAAVIRGVRSGRIESMALQRDGWVNVEITLDKSAVLPRDPVVLLNESSLFGEWQATLIERREVPRDADVQTQIADADRNDDVLPGATLPDLAKLTAVAGRIAGNVSDLAGRFEVAFSDSAAVELRSSIRNFAELTASLSQTTRTQSANFSKLSNDVRNGVDALARSAIGLQNVTARVDSSTADGEVNRIVSNAAAAAEELRLTSARLRALSEEFGGTQQALSSAIARTDSVMLKVNQGTGTLGRMVNDSALYQNSNALVAEPTITVSSIGKSREVGIR